jgi:light-independent protochlorophyllide reductase subunit B
VQDFPARYSPVMGFEGANVLFDTLVHPLVMGLEEHLLAMFREDFEFHDEAGPSHHGGKAKRRTEEGGQPPVAARGDSPRSISAKMMGAEAPLAGAAPDAAAAGDVVTWLADAERELKKIPFFVRGKAKRNTERFAAERGVSEISVETLYEAKAHYAR